MEKVYIADRQYKLLLVGGSAGSLRVILGFLPQLRKDLHLAIIIVVHRKNTSDTLLTDILSAKTQLPVKEAEEKEEILPGNIYVVPADYHLLIENDYTLSLDASEKVNFSRPSIDITFESAAYVYGSSLACLLLSGANTDGVEGMKMIKDQNGLLAIQDPSTAEMPVMPNGAFTSMNLDKVLLPTEMADFINNLPS